jgi:hypothetical protein
MFKRAFMTDSEVGTAHESYAKEIDRAHQKCKFEQNSGVRMSGTTV